MSAPKVDKAWVQARVNECGSVDKARPEGVSQDTWRDVCRKLKVSTRKRDTELEAALKALADGVS